MDAVKSGDAEVETPSWLEYLVLPCQLFTKNRAPLFAAKQLTLRRVGGGLCYDVTSETEIM
jgi:hypothetical protein